MSGLPQRAPYDPTRPFTVLRDFVFSGRTYLRGQRFDPSILVITDRKLLQMWQARHIDSGFLAQAPKREPEAADYGEDAGKGLEPELESSTPEVDATVGAGSVIEGN